MADISEIPNQSSLQADSNAEKIVEQNASDNQFGVSKIPAHAHTGTDSLPIDIRNVARFPSTPSQGDVVYYNGNAWVNLPAGTSGKFLETLGVGANPTWATVPPPAPQYPNWKMSIDSHDVSVTGTQTIAHGLGRTPSVVQISASLTNAPGLPFFQSVGSYDGSSQGCIASVISSGGLGGLTGTAYIIFIDEDGTFATKYATASAAVDPTNITLTWAKTGTPTGTTYFIWEVS